MTLRTRRSLALTAALGLALAAAAPPPAEASPATLKRSLQNIVFAPFDFVLTPVVTAGSWWTNWTEVDDSPGVHYAYAAPGLVWMASLQVGTSVIRLVAGGLELVPGIALLPFESDLKPVFNLPEENAALVDTELGGFAVRFGINYTSSTAAY